MCICRGVSLASQKRLEIQMKSSHLLLAKKEQNGNLINLQEVFDDYSSSNIHKITVAGQT